MLDFIGCRPLLSGEPVWFLRWRALKKRLSRFCPLTKDVRERVVESRKVNAARKASETVSRGFAGALRATIKGVPIDESV